MSYYIEDTITTLDDAGDGFWNGLLYNNGELFSGYFEYEGDYNSSGYYINGDLTTLNVNGDGFWNGMLYDIGMKQLSLSTRDPLVSIYGSSGRTKLLGKTKFIN